MRSTLFLFLYFLGISVSAQKLSGQWTGGFLSSGDPFGGHEYVLELEVRGSEVGGYSYTYFIIMGKRYYVICSLSGSYDKSSKSIVVTETAKIKHNTPPDFQDCLQTHMLTYLKKDGEETLEGRWKPAPGQNNCGRGETSLHRKTLVKVAPSQQDPVITQQNNTKPQAPANSGAGAKTGTTAPKPGTTAKSGVTPPKPANNTKPATGSGTKPPASKPLGNPQSGGTREKPTPPVAKTAPKPAPVTPSKTLEKPVSVDKPTRTTGNPSGPGTISASDMGKLEKRTKQVIKMIDVPESTIKVDLYDNGQVDGDTVSLYFNGKLIASKKRLTTSPITLQVKLDPDRNDNDLVMYAENLGSIPPNTALMVVTVADKRYEVNITSTEQTSGTVRFRLKE